MASAAGGSPTLLVEEAVAAGLGDRGCPLRQLLAAHRGGHFERTRRRAVPTSAQRGRGIYSGRKSAGRPGIQTNARRKRRPAGQGRAARSGRHSASCIYTAPTRFFLVRQPPRIPPPTD
eukprot:scaffold7876_cov67-Phaeocystis_antarctica.AAC.8